MRLFLEICQDICFPVALEKTHWGTTLLTFLGMMLDTENQMILIPREKVIKAVQMINFFIEKKNKKVTVIQCQCLCGYLNFLCKAIIPGRAFTRRLYSLTQSNKKLRSYHHVRVKNEHKEDLMIWREFLNYPGIFNRPFIDATIETALDMEIFSDASRNFAKGFGAYYKKSWTFASWNVQFMERFQPSIQYLELYAVTVAVLLWVKNFRNMKICLFCDND